MIDNTTEWRKSGLLIESVDSRPIKPLLDKIDAVLADHYAFTDEERDCVAGYDVKFRVGVEDDESE